MFPLMTADRLRWLLLAIAALALVLHSLAYNFVTDDAYISFVYSRNLAEHGELTFNLGQPVEGYTNFLWTVLVAGLMLLGLEPEITSRVLGTVCAVATLYVVLRVMERALGRRSAWAALPSILLACSSGYACWTSGGLETQLFTLLCAIAIDAVVAAEELAGEKALYRAGVALALAAMTRPEGMLVAAVIAIARITCNVLAKRRIVGRTELITLAWFVGIWAPWFSWRFLYYGWPFPNTYYVKASGPWTKPELAHQMWQNGLYYVWVWLQQTKLLYVAPIALLGLVAVKPRTPRFALGLTGALLAAVYLPYAVSVGGDFMGLHRFIMPVFVVAAIGLVLGLQWLCSLLPVSMRVQIGVAAAILLVAGFAASQALLTYRSTKWGNFDADRGLIDTPAYLIAYTEDRATIGKAMAGCFQDDDFSVLGGVGAQPYFGHMRGIDVFGLVSDRIAHEEPRQRARAGHTKFGSDPLLAQYDPTFVFSCYALHPTPQPPALPCNVGFWLAKGYEQVTMHIPGLQMSGEYYTFLAKKARNFQCPGRVH
jgi:hypothetical protein